MRIRFQTSSTAYRELPRLLAHKARLPVRIAVQQHALLPSANSDASTSEHRADTGRVSPGP